MSEQDWAEKAANEIVCDLEKLYGSMYSGATRKEWVTKYANIIRSTPSSDLVAKRVDQVRALYFSKESRSGRDAAEIREYCIHLFSPSALSGVAKVECEWNTDNYPYWTVSCMKVAPSTAFIEISTVIDEFKFCPYCGKSIKLKENGETEARHGK